MPSPKPRNPDPPKVPRVSPAHLPTSKGPDPLLAWSRHIVQAQADVTELVRRELDRLGPPSPLLDACKHALLTTPSNRIRAILVKGMGQAANPQTDLSLAIAGVEFVVSAAKAVDDLPSMDNSPDRGGITSVHTTFGTGTALLASYALIAGGYACLQHCAHQIASSSVPHAAESYLRLARVVQELSHSIGAGGAALGQLRDLANLPMKDEEELLSVIDLKTSQLYVMAATAGWVLAGGNLEQLPTVHAAATHLGRGMQIKDDIEDAPQDTAAGRRCNYATEYGLTLAYLRLRAELDAYRAAIQSLPGDRSTLEALALPILLALRSHGTTEPTDC